MSKKHNEQFKLREMRRILNAICKLCNLRVCDLNNTMEMAYLVLLDGKPYVWKSFLSYKASNKTERFKGLLDMIIDIKQRGPYKFIFEKMPSVESIEELELKLAMRGY